MSRPCAIVACGKHASGYSTQCELHKRNMRRHGHPEQSGVTVHDLRPFLEAIAARRAKNPSNPTWQLLARRWQAVTGHAEAILAASAAGAVCVSYERQTAAQLLILRDSVPDRVVIDTALAMFGFQERRPSRFKSDKAFAFQLARRIRGLARVNAGAHTDARSGCVKRTYRDTPPRVLACLAATLTAAFGVAGLQIAKLDAADAVSGDAERQQLHEALRGLQ